MKTTNRGFIEYKEFIDLNNTTIRVQESSLATQPAVWIFTENKEDGRTDVAGMEGKPFKMDAHLSISQTKKLIKSLQMFIDNNRFSK